MYYIFDRNNNCIMTCDHEPDLTDLGSRGEYAFFSHQNYPLGEVVIENGILGLKTKTVFEVRIEKLNLLKSSSQGTALCVINTKAPEHKQRNATASLSLIQMGLEPLEGYDLEACKSIFKWVECVRKVVDTKEQELNNAYTLEDIEGVDISYETILKESENLYN